MFFSGAPRAPDTGPPADVRRPATHARPLLARPHTSSSSRTSAYPKICPVPPRLSPLYTVTPSHLRGRPAWRTCSVRAFLFCVAKIWNTAAPRLVGPTRADGVKAATALRKPSPEGLATAPRERLDMAFASNAIVLVRSAELRRFSLASQSHIGGDWGGESGGETGSGNLLQSKSGSFWKFCPIDLREAFDILATWPIFTICHPVLWPNNIPASPSSCHATSKTTRRTTMQGSAPCAPQPLSIARSSRYVVPRCTPPLVPSGAASSLPPRGRWWPLRRRVPPPEGERSPAASRAATPPPPAPRKTHFPLKFRMPWTLDPGP